MQERRKSQEPPKKLQRPQTVFQEAPGGPRKRQKTPKESQEVPGSPKSAQEAPARRAKSPKKDPNETKESEILKKCKKNVQNGSQGAETTKNGSDPENAIEPH